MRHTDIAIVGGGLAGSTMAAMCGRAGLSSVMIDPHPAYPSDLRCEKLSTTQIEILHKLGLAEAAFQAGTEDHQIWTARYGSLIDKRPSDQYGITYASLVNTIRAEIPAAVETVYGKVAAISTSDDRQTVTLANGDLVSARLVVLSTGLNLGLRQQLGIERRIISECHCITVAFDVAPIGRPSFDFPALTYFSERPSDLTAYLTLFPIESGMRANLFVYRPMSDPWLRAIRQSPEDALHALLPKLRRLTGDFKVTGDVKIRPQDLYVSSGHRRAGIVLVGDAFATSCPSAGTGADKVFNDVERLCNVHMPNWLATPGMAENKIAQYYDDPVKLRCDAWSADKAFHFRSVSIETGLPWRARRWVRYAGRKGQGMLRRAYQRLAHGRGEMPFKHQNG